MQGSFSSRQKWNNKIIPIPSKEIEKFKIPQKIQIVPFEKLYEAKNAKRQAEIAALA